MSAEGVGEEKRRSGTSTACTRRGGCSSVPGSSTTASARSRGLARARFLYVFHGSSGSSDAEVREAVRYGVVKLNVDSDDQYAFTRAIADHVLGNYAGVLRVDGGVGEKDAYDPRAWGRKGEAAMAARVAATCDLVGSAGQSLVR